MRILKIKEWLLKPKPQFEIVEEINGKIITVKRLKDGLFYTLGTFDTDSSSITITRFDPNLIHIIYTLLFRGSITSTKECNSQINYLNLTYRLDKNNWALTLSERVKDARIASQYLTDQSLNRYKDE